MKFWFINDFIHEDRHDRIRTNIHIHPITRNKNQVCAYQTLKFERIGRKINRLLIASFRLRCWCISRKKILWKLVTAWHTHTYTHMHARIPRKRSTCRRYRWCNDALPRYLSRGRHYGEIENTPVRRKNSNKRCTKVVRPRRWNVTFISIISTERSTGNRPGVDNPAPWNRDVETSPETCARHEDGLTPPIAARNKLENRISEIRVSISGIYSWYFSVLCYILMLNPVYFKFNDFSFPLKMSEGVREIVANERCDEKGGTW